VTTIGSNWGNTITPGRRNISRESH
jgi:hypothetical protein